MKVFRCKCGAIARMRKRFVKTTIGRMSLYAIRCKKCGSETERDSQYDAATAWKIAHER